jgi:hypothetical protein
MRTEKETECTGFNCARINTAVNIRRTYRVCFDGMHEIKRFLIFAQCDHELQCGIGNAEGSAINIDRSQCVCPFMK